jgi:hypothetical protein
MLDLNHFFDHGGDHLDHPHARDVATPERRHRQVRVDVRERRHTALEVVIDGHKIGVSVVRAMTFPFGEPYTVDAATTIMQRKLEDIQASSINVSEQDRWEADPRRARYGRPARRRMVEQVWSASMPRSAPDTVLVVTVTSGDDLFIYNE